MLPRELLAAKLEGRRVIPSWLGARDEPWLCALLDEHAAYVGRPRRDFFERLKEPLKVCAPLTKLRIAVWVLERLSMRSRTGPIAPSKLRKVVFRAAAGLRPRAAALEEAAAELGISPAIIDELLFADLADERRLGPLAFPLSAGELAVEANLALASGLLRRATRVWIRLGGQARAIMRQAKHRGLICVARPLPDGQLAAGAVLEVSGPFELFRHTQMYGRALAALLPHVASCPGYELRADCVLGQMGEVFMLRLRWDAPIKPAKVPQHYDGKLERAFARDFARVAPDWDIIQAPAPIAAGRALVFPDFELAHRKHRNERWQIELVGFWTSGYLENKLATICAVENHRLIVCVDERLNCGRSELPEGAALVRFRGRLDPLAILRIIEPARCLGR